MNPEDDEEDEPDITSMVAQRRHPPHMGLALVLTHPVGLFAPVGAGMSITSLVYRNGVERAPHSPPNQLPSAQTRTPRPA